MDINFGLFLPLIYSKKKWYSLQNALPISPKIKFQNLV